MFVCMKNFGYFPCPHFFFLMSYNSQADGLEIASNGDIRVPCIALLCCNYKQCDRDVFAAINDSGLVFDGGLVVDAVSFVVYLFACLVRYAYCGWSTNNVFHGYYNESNVVTI